MSIFKKPVFLDSARAAALSLILGLVLALAPLFAILAVPLLPIPAAFVASKHGVARALVVSLIPGALVIVFTGFPVGLFVIMLTGLAGTGMGICLRLGITQLRLFVALTLLFCLVMSLWTGSLLTMAGTGPVAAVERLADQAIEPTRELYLSLGMSQQGVDDLLLQARDFAVALPYRAPALILIFSLMLSGASIAVARRAFNRLGQAFPQDFAFRDLRLHFGFAYMMIVGLVLELAAPFLPEAYGFPLDMAGGNLLIVAEVLFFIQGIAIATHILGHYKVSRIRRAGVYICLALLQATLSLTSWMGLFDTWIDYRRRFTRRQKALKN